MLKFAAALAAALVTASAAFAQDAPFEDWRDGFAQRLASDGVRAETVSSMLDGLEPDERVIERDGSQPEFVRPIWEYLDSAVSADRVANGEAAHARVARTIEAVEAEYGVESEVLAAIWGLETAYGEITGDFDVVRSLATLAWEGRRRGFAEDQLRAIAQMIENGYARREDLKGSWAGAMGDTQFIPTTYMERAVDFDGDGRRDIWNSEADALASAANLLARAGWERGEPILAEAVLPEGFDYAGWNEDARRPVAEWAQMGVRPAGGSEFSANDLNRSARLIVPAGADGPAFLAYSNFQSVLRYNNSTAYALGVGYLARAIAGEGGRPQGWPEDNPPITRSQSRDMQERLTALGHDTGGVDGMIGPNTRSALRAFQREQGMEPDGYAGRATYDAVVAASDN